LMTYFQAIIFHLLHTAQQVIRYKPSVGRISEGSPPPNESPHPYIGEREKEREKK